MIIGHKRQTEYFQKVLARGALAHAYLFHGPANVGKRTIAEEIARALLCEKSKKGFGGCGACDSCVRASGGAHENVIRLSREETLVSKKESRKEIPIEDIRELRRVLSFSPQPGIWRVVIVSDVEQLSQEAAHAFLKLLEEPPARTVFFLIAEHIEYVLLTIRSRTQGIYFSLVLDDAIRGYLMGHAFSRARADEICAYAAGRAGVAVGATQKDDAIFESEKRARGVSHALVKGAPFFFPYAEKAASDEDIRLETADSVIRTLRERLLEEAHVPAQARLAKQVKNVVRITEAMVRTNVNPRLSLDLIFFEGSEGMKR